MDRYYDGAGYFDVAAHGAAQRTGSEFVKIVFSKYFVAILVIIVIVLIARSPHNRFVNVMSKMSPDDAFFEHIAGKWYTKQHDGDNSRVVAIEFAVVGDKIMLTHGESAAVEVEKLLKFSLFYPRLNAKLHFSAVMPSGKLRAVDASVAEDVLYLDVANEEKTKYYRDQREADALP